MSIRSSDDIDTTYYREIIKWERAVYLTKLHLFNPVASLSRNKSDEELQEMINPHVRKNTL